MKWGYFRLCLGKHTKGGIYEGKFHLVMERDEHGTVIFLGNRVFESQKMRHYRMSA